ncbi:MAG: hypothetical protein ACEQSR_11230 [Candidatus Methylacidiphilales bacterium]
MKIRIKGNSIRIRLTQTEVKNFADNKYIEEATEFIDNKLFYALAASPNVSELSAQMVGNKITLLVPEQIVQNWTTTDLVGFENEFNIGDNKKLFLLVEKDFVCLDNTFEDQSDMFPNPNAVC